MSELSNKATFSFPMCKTWDSKLACAGFNCDWKINHLSSNTGCPALEPSNKAYKLEESELESMSNKTEIQCNCGKALFFKDNSPGSEAIEIKCQRCKRIHRLTLTELAAAVTEKLKIA